MSAPNEFRMTIPAEEGPGFPRHAPSVCMMKTAGVVGGDREEEARIGRKENMMLARGTHTSVRRAGTMFGIYNNEIDKRKNISRTGIEPVAW